MNESSEVRGEYFFLRGSFRPRKYPLPDAATEVRIRGRQKWVDRLTILGGLASLMAVLFRPELSLRMAALTFAVSVILLGLILERTLVAPLLRPYRVASAPATRHEKRIHYVRNMSWGFLCAAIVLLIFFGVNFLARAAMGDYVLFMVVTGGICLGLSVHFIRTAVAKHRDETALDRMDLESSPRAR